MDKRIKLGLIYSYDEGWIAGAYYIENLIHALNTLPDSEKPEIYIFSYSKEDFQRLQDSTGYPYILFYPINIKYNLVEKGLNKIFRYSTNKNLIEKRPKNKIIDILFPAVDTYYFRLIAESKKIYWIPDFQEHHLPQFFSESRVLSRKRYQSGLIEKKANIVFSSEDAKNDFNQIYPFNNCQKYVLSFAVSHPSYKHLDMQPLREKYGLPEKYFFSPNQFWAHKNHIVVLKAVKKLKEDNINVVVAFSGKAHDDRNPDYYKEIEKFVDDNQLINNIMFLGFIDRKEQLKIMEQAIAVVQPSLFEGWSTVVEDAKAMNQFLILSDLNVHQEQTKVYRNVLLFDPNNELELAEKIEYLLNYPLVKAISDYLINIKKFGEKFMAISKSVFIK